MLEAGGGGGGAFYAVQIESLEQFQQKLTGILQGLEADGSVMGLSDTSGTFGEFPEAQSFSSVYEQTKQDLVNSFNEVTQLVNTMISVVGSNAAKYKQTEQDITSKFNAILQQYGDTPAAPVSGTTYYPQSNGSSTGTTSTSTSTSTSTTGTGTNTDTSTTTSTPGTTQATSDPSSNNGTTTTTPPAGTSAGAA